MTIEGKEKLVKKLRKELRYRLRNDGITMKEVEEEAPKKKRRRKADK